MKPSSHKRKEEHWQQEKITPLVCANHCNNSITDSVRRIMLDNTCGVFWLLRERYTTDEITQVVMVMWGTTSTYWTSEIVGFSKTNWKWHTVYTELRFSFTAGLVFNLSIHWAHGISLVQLCFCRYPSIQGLLLLSPCCVLPHFQVCLIKVRQSLLLCNTV